MRLTGEEIPAIAFLISSIGFVILTIIQFRNGKNNSFNTIFLLIMAIIFFVCYIILIIQR